MIIEPMATSPCLAYRLNDIKTAIERYLIANGLNQQIRPVNNILGQPALVLNAGKTIECKSFGHAIPVEYQGTTYWVTDVRAYTNVDQFNNAKVTAVVDYQSAVIRATLQAIWASSDSSNLRNVGDLPMMVFSDWVADCLSRAYALPTEIHVNVMILAAYYWWCCTNNIADYDPKEFNTTQIAALIGKVKKVSYDYADGLLSGIAPIKDADHFIQVLKSSCNTTRLDRLSLPVLYQVCGGVLTNNSREVMCVALEHAPTFMGVLYLAIDSSGLHKTNLSKICDRYERRPEYKTYHTSVKELLRSSVH